MNDTVNENDGSTRDDHTGVLNDEVIEIGPVFEETTQQLDSDNELGIGKRTKRKSVRLKDYLVLWSKKNMNNEILSYG